MRKKKRGSVIFMIALTLVFALSACDAKIKRTGATGDTPDDIRKKTTVTMGFWGTNEELKIYQEAAASIGSQYPNIELNIRKYTSRDQFLNEIPIEISTHVAPDFIKFSNEDLLEYISKGLIAPVDDLIISTGLDMNKFSKPATDIWKIDGKQYGIPNSISPAMFFINTDMWKKVGLGAYPTTWDEVEVAAKKLTSEEIYGITINLDPYHITNYVKSYGGGWNYGRTINSKENVQALQKIFDMYEAGVAITPKSLGYGWDGELFANNKSAMTTGGYWYKGFLKDAAPNLNYAVLPVPRGTTNGSTMISDAYVVLKDTKNKEAALKAAYYLTNEKTQNEFMAMGLNSALSFLSDRYFVLNPEFRPVKQALDYSTDFAYPVETKKFQEELVNQLNSTILGDAKKTPKEVLDTIQTKFK